MLQVPIFRPNEVERPLRPYQASALEQASAATEKHSSILVVMPTGTGKTRLATEACHRHVALGGRAMFVAPRRELVQQAAKTLSERGLRPEYDVFVRTIQELTLANASIPPVSMVVLDEARHYVADEWSSIKRALPNDTVILGLDATPERGDGRGLAPFFEVLIEALSIKDAVAQGFLVPCEVIRPARALQPGEFAQDPVDTYVAHCTFDRVKDLSTVIFAPSVDLAKLYAMQLRSRGIPAEAVWGEMPTSMRDEALRAYDEGKVSVLCNVNLLTEGWDSPRTEVVMLARSFATQGQMLQAAGRGMRPHASKRRMLLIDLTGCTHILGDPDEPRTWHVEGRAARRASDSVDVRFCPVCGAPVEKPPCAQCGHAGEMRKRKPRVLGLPMDRFARERQQSDEEKAKRLAGYLHTARRKGRETWWAVKCFEGVYGHRPSPTLMRMARRL